MILRLCIILNFILLVACSGIERMPKESNQLTSLDSGLIIEEVGEDGIVELVIPEMLEYTELKEKINQQENIKQMELGSETPIFEDNLMDSASPPVSILIQDEFEQEFIPIVETQVQYELEFVKGSFEKYIVQKNDSLMLIAYKLYGDFSQWRELASWNKELLTTSSKIRHGQVLKVRIIDGDGKVWAPEGNPYLVKRGDYLGKVSRNVYNGNAKYWVNIWNNNKALIQDPDKIYAGFTIYTPTLESFTANRELSSE